MFLYFVGVVVPSCRSGAKRQRGAQRGQDRSVTANHARRDQPGRSRRAVANTDCSISGVSFFVFVFCRLGWYDAITVGPPAGW
jgi:hypothetical protein